MHKLIEYVCDELEALEKKAAKGSMSAAEIEYADKLASLKKNLLKGEMLYDEVEGGEYSGNMGGGSYARGGRGGNRGNMGGSSNRGGSYRGGSYEGSYDGGSYEGGSYARGRGRNAKRDSMGRYSSESGYSRADVEEFVDELREMMGDLPREAQQDAQRLMQKLEQSM